MATGDRMCPGCKEPYEVHHEAVVAHDNLQEEDHVVGNPKLESRLSLIDSTEPKSMKNQTFDLNLFKTKGNYGYGNAMRTKNDSDDEAGSDFELLKNTEKEPALITSNTILSILAADYPVEKLSCYVSDDGGSLLVFEAIAEAANFAYFQKPISIRREIRIRTSAYNAQEDMKVVRQWRDVIGDESVKTLNIPKATWLADGSHWPGTWNVPAHRHSSGDHASVIRVMLRPGSDEPIKGGYSNSIDLTDVEINLQGCLSQNCPNQSH
ncbi:hypothetical protein Dsin_006308 [Dipteronia sinensis]|uniref:Uncharacterized protein n=1 Tax=Dipteronia sinensis TaxID=43782 RepID=A0AAE0EFI0_9ROSI|nr:hypothetical protein Dsin_006308 [Dipteronia sinensis]